MRISLVILFGLFIVVVNSATTKAPARKSAYAYLRTVRGKNSCASGSCPFWDQHGRSFVSLRCYAEQYKDCTCLHRMCFSSCLFTPQECNAEMVQCLKEICPRCLPASSVGICSVYDSVAVRVTQALATFACYPCCPYRFPGNNTTKPHGIPITPPKGNGVILTGNVPATGVVRPQNGVPQNGGNRPVNGGTGPVNGVNRPVNGVNRPVNGGSGSTNGINRPNTGNQAPGNGLPSNNNNGANRNQPVQQKVRPAVRVVTTRRTAATTRRATTVSGNKIKKAVVTTVKTQKKP